jgi:hypothetical protein
MPFTAIRGLSAVVLSIALGAAAYAQDVVEVTNGDRFNGTVSRLQRGKLAFRTDAAGTISIDWAKVVTLSSNQNLDVELESGVRYTGTIASPAPGQLVVQTASGPTPPIDLKEIVRIIPIDAFFRGRTTGSIGFGATFTKADGARAYTLDANASNRTRSYETLVSVHSWLQRRSDEDTLTRNNLGADVRRYFARRWYAMGTFGFQEDDGLDLDWRVIAGGGVGRRLVQSNAMLLSVQGGLDYNSESYGSEDSAAHSAELFAGVDWDYFSPAWATEALVVATTYISLERQRARLQLDAQMRRDIFWSMYWSVNVFESFDSDPPGDRERSNLGLSFALGWAF